MNPVDMHLAGTGGANVDGASDDVVSDADVNPMSSREYPFINAQGKYHHLYNDK
jgi:hypothetical protein